MGACRVEEMEEGAWAGRSLLEDLQEVEQVGRTASTLTFAGWTSDGALSRRKAGALTTVRAPV
jgi:hypothetical protein